jgi:hypothetical protein
LLFVALVAAPVQAQPVSPPTPAEPRPPAAARTEAAGDEKPKEGEEPRNEIALVLAGTRERAERTTSLTLGAEYERRLTRRLGIIGELEYVKGPGTWVFAVPFVLRPVGGGFKLFGGPGVERRIVAEAPNEFERTSAASEAEPETLFLWRVGTAYAWEFNERYVVGPSVYLDFVREAPGEWKRAFVFGVSLGISF